MPIRDDFIVRMLDQVGAAIARVLTGEAPQDLVEAERQLAGAYVELTGSGRDLVARLSSEQLLAILGAPARFNRERGYVLARLLEADARLEEVEASVAGGGAGGEPEPENGAAGSDGVVSAPPPAARPAVDGRGPSGSGRAPSADVRRLKALDLYLEAARAGLDEDDLEQRIAGLRAALAEVALPEPSHWRAFQYAAETGRFAEAEDLLFEGVERFGAGAEVTTRGRAFYRDLEAAADEALAAGGLPRDEVAEGRSAFEAALGRGRQAGAGEAPR